MIIQEHSLVKVQTTFIHPCFFAVHHTRMLFRHNKFIMQKTKVVNYNIRQGILLSAYNFENGLRLSVFIKNVDVIG